MLRAGLGTPRALLVALSVVTMAGIGQRTLGQTTSGTSGRTTVDPYMGGMAPAPPGYTYAPRGSITAQSSAGTNPNMTDPLGFGYVYGPGIPMTSTQVGMSMLLMQQRMLGIGNGQLSGSRPGATANPNDRNARYPSTSRPRMGGPGAHPSEAHTANMNVPGGQAARYFNRGANLATSRSQPYYRRQGRFFPQSSQ